MSVEASSFISEHAKYYSALTHPKEWMLTHAIGDAMAIRQLMETMTDRQRLGIIAIVTSGVCIHCGETVGDRICHCMNDE